MNKPSNLEFPCSAIPAEAATARLLGLYPMRQEGLLMQRVKVPGGALSAAQLRTLADAAEALTPGYPLHLTTRQDVEIHGARPQDVPALQRAAAGAGLTTVGACGDTMRNITVCPGAGRCPESSDVRGVARAIGAAVEALDCVRSLPRKFKVSVSGCGNGCARPFINDIGLVAEAGGRFRAVVAGSLGPRPGLGVEFPRRLAAGETVAFVVGAIRFFNTEGDRVNRGRARLRHVRERLGDADFIARLAQAFEAEVKLSGACAIAQPGAVPSTVREPLRLHPPLGDLTPAEARQLADVVGTSGAALCVGFEHDLWLFGVERGALGALLGWLDLPSIVACPGSTWCSRGIADTRAAAKAIAKVLQPFARISVSISGCPNNCSHAAVADIGLVGRVSTVDGVRTECYRVLEGGGKGRTGVLATETEAAVPAGALEPLIRRICSARDGLG